jgi:hypothetical protein
MLVAVAAGVSVLACSGSNTATHASTSPTVDAGTVRYLALVNGFWTDHVRATNGAVVACLGSSPGTTNGINPSRCKTAAIAMLAVQNKFTTDLAAVTAPSQFATEDHTFRTQLPIANADLTALIAVCDGQDPAGIQNASETYISDMGPILDALDKLSPGVEHV